MIEPALEVSDLRKYYPVKKLFQGPRSIKALDGVSFTLQPNRTLAVVGESGCGKSTLAKVLTQVEEPTGGSFRLEGRDAGTIPVRERVRLLQMIFQDPYSSINPRKKTWQIIAEPLRIHSTISTDEARTRALEIMGQVGLGPEAADRYPHMFSGGQRQRIGIARALILQPKIMICDEPVSALDISIQAQVINLLIELQDAWGLSYLFISHDLSVVRHLADDVLVMYLGKIVEYGPRSAIFGKSKHPYTRALLASSPHFGLADHPDRVVLGGELPSPLDPPSGCALHRRCPFASPRCKVEVPVLKQVGDRKVACHLFE